MTVFWANPVLSRSSAPQAASNSESTCLWILPLWVATVVLSHVSLTDPQPVYAFARLTCLAWPAALLALWRWGGSRVPAAATATVSVAVGAFGVWWGIHNVAEAVRVQKTGPAIERFVAAEEPLWLDLRSPIRGGLLGRVEDAFARP